MINKYNFLFGKESYYLLQKILLWGILYSTNRGIYMNYIEVYILHI